MYLPVNTRDEDNPILAILGGMAETFFLSEIGMWASGKSACVAVSCKCLHLIRVFCIDDLYHTVSPTFFLSEIGMCASGKSACVAVSCKCLHLIRVFCIDDLYHTVSPWPIILWRQHPAKPHPHQYWMCHKIYHSTILQWCLTLFERDEQISVS